MEDEDMLLDKEEKKDEKEEEEVKELEEVRYVTCCSPDSMLFLTKQSLSIYMVIITPPRM